MKKHFLQNFLLMFVASFLSILLSNLIFDSATLPAAAQSTSASVSGRIPSPQAFAAFGIRADFEPFVPQGLPESNNPTSGRGVLGLDDDRVAMRSTFYPWSTIGRLVSPAGENMIDTCTGSLVAPDVVLTNAHCIINSETHQPKAQTRFMPNLIDGRVQDEADVANVIDFIRGTDFRDDNSVPQPEDWAFLKLDKPIGEKYGTLAWRSLPMSSLVADFQQRLILPGYSADFPPGNPGRTAGVHMGCSILGEVEGNIIHDCDTTGGSSGGPILASIDGEFRIVALNSAERIEEETVENGDRVRRGIVNYGIKISEIVNVIQN